MRISFGFGVPGFKSKSGIQNPKLGTRNRMVASFPLLHLPRDGEEKRGGRFDGRQSFCFFDFNAKPETRDPRLLCIHC